MVVHRLLAVSRNRLGKKHKSSAHRHPWITILVAACLSAFPFALPLLAQTADGASEPACKPGEAPAPAKALGFTRAAITLCPKLADISTSGLGTAALYNGHQWQKPIPAPSLYTSSPDGGLRMIAGGTLCSVSHDMQAGTLPLLDGSRGFYVEFTTRLSDDDPDHFPAVWLMPVEHNAAQHDHYDPDPKGYERYLELDVDEGGFTKGFMGTAIAWEGIWPHYQRTRSNPIWAVPPLDRSKTHTFAALFDPTDLRVSWFLDGKLQYTATGPAVPRISLQQHFYLILEANQHDKKIPYYMDVLDIRAFTP